MNNYDLLKQLIEDKSMRFASLHGFNYMYRTNFDSPIIIPIEKILHRPGKYDIPHRSKEAVLCLMYNFDVSECGSTDSNTSLIHVVINGERFLIT